MKISNEVLTLNECEYLVHFVRLQIREALLVRRRKFFILQDSRRTNSRLQVHTESSLGIRKGNELYSVRASFLPKGRVQVVRTLSSLMKFC